MGKLYIVATPIGNLEDLSPRALSVLQEVDCLLCENPNHTKKLLYHFKIKQSTIQIADFNEKSKLNTVLERLNHDQTIAIVSDAGTPLISDPGYALVDACLKAGHRVIPIAGPCALIAALSCSGLPTDRFCFEGFLPAKSTQRRKHLEALKHATQTMIFYESPHRLFQSLEDCCRAFGLMRMAVLTRELTKLHETIHRAPLGQLLQWAILNRQDIGECTLIIQGAQPISFAPDIDMVVKILSSHLSGKSLVEAVSQLCGCRKQEVYQYLQHHSK